MKKTNTSRSAMQEIPIYSILKSNREINHKNNLTKPVDTLLIVLYYNET